MNKKLIGVAMGFLCIGIIIGALISFSINYTIVLQRTIGVDIEATRSIHATVWFYKDGELIFTYTHPGVLTNLGRNITLAKLSGDSGYNLTWYNWNTTYISIGNQGVLSNSSTVLPGEWNRTTATVEDITATGTSYSYNLTCTFYPDAAGPYTADCIGINVGSGTIGADETLWAYDTFTEVTGIDETFTINVEFKISITYQ
jgi:hypothetical protein